MNTNHIVFFTQLYYPDMTTTAIIMTDLVEDLAAYGMRPLKNGNFCSSSRKAKISTTGAPQEVPLG